MEVAIRYADFGSMEEVKFLMDNYSDEKALQERLDLHNEVSDNGTAIRYKGQKKDIWNLRDRIELMVKYPDLNRNEPPWREEWLENAVERAASLFAKS